MLNKFYAKLLIMAGAALVLSACANSGSDTMDNTPPPEPAPQQTQQPAPTPAPVDTTTQVYLESQVMGGGMDASLVHFAFDRYDIDATARNILQAQANWMKANPSVNVIIEGHCDERGTREYNIALGDRRANAVKNYLVAMGVSASRIRTVSYGKERPISTVDAENRRGKTRVN